MAGNFLQDALIYLGAGIVCVPIAKRLGIGSVLGYLIGGIVVGPYVLGLVGKEGLKVMHASEFGVVMMLFLIGLELNPQAFWRMRRVILGMGGLQMALTALLLLPVLWQVFDLPLHTAIGVSLAFAMSSTAIVLQTLKEKSLDKTNAGRSAFAVLLFQDVAVIPLLALLPLLAGVGPVVDAGEGSVPPMFGILQDYPTLLLILAVGFVYVLSRFLVGPLLHIIAKSHTQELFTATALFVVIGVSWLMEKAGISAALGAFMAGVLLANSEFRHELEVNIVPFKGILLGIFFTAVGATINFTVILGNPLRIVAAVLLVMSVKALVLAVLARLWGLKNDQNVLFALLLSQVGEFAFVLLAAAWQTNLIDVTNLDFFKAVVTLSMLVSPVLLYVNERYIDPYFGVKESDAQAAPADAMEEKHEVILTGFGHFGSTLGRFLRANGVEATILDHDSDRVQLLRKMGFKVFYGDGTRLDLLESAGAHKARILISAIDVPEKNLELAELVKKHFPHLEFYVRAQNRYDAYELIDKGIAHVYRESLYTSVFMGADVLNALGHRKYTMFRKALEFIRYDEKSLHRLAKLRHHQETYIAQAREEIEVQERLLKQDARFADLRSDHAWDKTPLVRQD